MTALATPRLIANEARLLGRNLPDLLPPIGVPVGLMLVISLGGGTEPLAELGGRSPMELFAVPVALTMIAAMIGTLNMPAALVGYRQTGVLRRMALTPVGPARILAAHVAVSAAQALAGTAVALGVLHIAFGLRLPGSPWAALGILLLGLAAMYGTGLFIAAVSRTYGAALGIGLMVFFVSMGIGGGVTPADNLPDGLAAAGQVLPFGAMTAALTDAWSGSAAELPHLAVLAVFAVAGTGTACLLFRWE